MGLVDKKNPYLFDLLQWEQMALQRDLKDYTIQWATVSNSSMQCSKSDEPSECVVLKGKETAPQTVKILLSPNHSGRFFTIYDQSVPQRLLEKLQMKVETLQEVEEKLDEATWQLVVSGVTFEDASNARLWMLGQADCECLQEVTTDTLISSMMHYLWSRKVLRNITQSE